MHVNLGCYQENEEKVLFVGRVHESTGGEGVFLTCLGTNIAGFTF